MKKILFIILLCLSIGSCNQKTQYHLIVKNLTCEYTHNPSGIETLSPALGWQIESDGRNALQTAYRILVADNPEHLTAGERNCWDSGKVRSDNSLQVFYNGIPLNSATTYYWKVKVWDNHGNESEWSKPAEWQMGLLSKSDWKGAQWIALQELPAEKKVVPGIHGRGPDSLGDMKNILPIFRREFSVQKPLKCATAFVSGLGHFEISLNGKKVGDHFLDPGWTAYEKYALYVTFDITSYLQQGANACGIMLGNGFYHTPRERYLKCVVSHGYPKAVCRILLEYTDGSTADIITDESWRTDASPITFSSIYGGENYDARLEQNGWDQPGFDDSSWQCPLVVAGPELRSQTATPVKIMETIVPQRIFQSKKGQWVYDLGQNASGIISLSINASKGQTVKIWPGELIDDDSIVTQQASGKPFWFEYTAAGRGIESWQPKFTYYGFRYLMLEGAIPEGKANPGKLPVVTAIAGLHTRNAASQTGTFTCSNGLFNRIFRLIDWSIRSNIASVLTDCPHREKLGWLEQAHLMGSSIQYNYNINSLYNKIINDMQSAQLPNGLVPDIAPEIVIFIDGYRDSPEWGSAYVILPWYLYRWYGDKRPLQTHYEGMKKYVAYLSSTATDHIVSHGLGDWFDLGPNPPAESQLTSKGVTATAIYYYNVCIMRQVAGLLGKNDDKIYFGKLAGNIKEAFNKKFFHADIKQYDRNSQAANAMAIYMGLVEPEHRKDVFNNIIADLKSRDFSLTPGDIGFRYLLRVLESEGASETIFTINNRNDVPGYGFQLAKGATALTESWAALRFVSNNHCMLGHLMEWFYSGLGGISQDEGSTAFRNVIIKPEPVGDITSASVSYVSPYGTVVSDWKRNEKGFYLDVEIPANTTAQILFPSGDWKSLTEKGKKIKTKADAEGRKTVKTGSGKYRFVFE